MYIRAAGAYEDMRTGPHHVFRIVRETSVSILVYFFHKKAKLIYDLQNRLNQFLSFLAFEIMLHLI